MRPLAVVLLTHEYELPRWQAESLQRLESAGAVAVTGIIGLGARAGSFERLCRSVQETLERGGAEPLAAALDARSVFPRAQAAGGHAGMPLADLVVSCAVDSRLASGVRGRLGTLACSFAGAEDEIGLFRALACDCGFDLEIRLLTASGEFGLASAWPELPDRPLLACARRNVLRRAGSLLEKSLRELAQDGPRAASAAAHPAAPPVTPSVACRYGSRRATDLLRRGLQKLGAGRTNDTDRNWFLAYRTNPEAFVRNNERFRAEGFRLILPPPGRFYADPCVFEHQGEDHVFLEDWRSDVRKGVVSWMKRDGERFTPPEPVLERPYHVSYPFVFRAGADIFMIPESSSTRRIELYRAVDFPERWEPAAVLVDGIVAADATVAEIDGSWWMFANVGEDGSSRCDQLWLFHADAVGGPWRPHPRNPVKIDVRSTRPGGSLFRRGGKLIRPAQDSSMAYGGALTLCEVTRLSRTDYAEVEIDKLLPGWLPSNLGLHTLSSSARLEVIDGKMPSGKESRFPVLEGALYLEAPA